MNYQVPEGAFLPTSREEMEALGWQELDVLLITGDCYVDHPSFGIAIIGRLISSLGFRVGIIAQPDWNKVESLTVMGAPRLAIGVTSGNMDSMINLYTAGRRLRRDDAFSENGTPGRRPPHALGVYSQLARRAFPGIPIFTGGIEASLRRVVHYDYWQDKIRPSTLATDKADLLIYGMGEKPVTELMQRLSQGKDLAGIRGTARLLGKKDALAFNNDQQKYVELPSFEDIQNSKDALMTATKILEAEMNPYRGKGLLQKHGDRLLVVEPPPMPLTPQELDRVHELPYVRKPHSKYKGKIPAFATIASSIQVVRGCPGGCAFCGLVAHQGHCVMSRSPESVIREAEQLAASPDFKGTISDVGGAAGNIYGSSNDPERCAKCKRASWLFPVPCPGYKCDGKELAELLRSLRRIPKIKHVHINSGLRLEIALRQPELLQEIIRHHVSGHLKVAPEHLDPEVLRLMRKGSAEEFFEFFDIFTKISKECGKEQYIIPLFISNFPGCTAKAMQTVEKFLDKHHWSLQQVQDYIPLPGTMGAAMYYCGKDSDGNVITVNRGLAERRPQINVLKQVRTWRPGDKKNQNSKGGKNNKNNKNYRSKNF
jgi:uncharacterized radical SAM protein YgiQ